MLRKKKSRKKNKKLYYWLQIWKDDQSIRSIFDEKIEVNK